MSAIVLIDTSIYLNILDVPGRNQARDAVFAELERHINARDHLLLPAASIWKRAITSPVSPTAHCVAASRRSS